MHAQLIGIAYKAPPCIRDPLDNTRRGVELIHLTAKSPPISVGVVGLKLKQRNDNNNKTSKLKKIGKKFKKFDNRKFILS